MKVEVIQVNPNISLKRATDGSAAIDVQSTSEVTVVSPGEVVKFPLGFKLNINDPNVAAILLPRSGLGTKYRVVLANLVGLIDSDYQGEVIAAIVNDGDESFVVNPYDRIGQLVFVPIIHPELVMVEEFSNSTTRGEGGFGSTGK